MDGLTEGRIVHFVMPNGEHRPAIVVKVWNKTSGTSNLTVFSDWMNDGNMPNMPHSANDVARGIFWATSVMPDEETKAPNTWHWIEKA